MSKNNLPIPAGLPALLKDIKARIQQAQTRAILSVNGELVRLYWDIGRLIDERQRREGWGAAVIPRLAHELRNELPEEKGFSERNLDRMIAFFRAYTTPGDFSPPPVAKLPAPQKSPPPVAKLQIANSLLWLVPWAHDVVLMEKVKSADTRIWYMQQTLAHGWSRNVLLVMLRSEAHVRQGKAITNFAQKLPAPQSDLARQALKDPYIFDFLTIQEPFHERELETNLLNEVQHFLLELGQGFAFVGRQYRIEAETPTLNSPIGVSQYELTRALPAKLEAALPTVEQIEAELADVAETPPVSARQPSVKKIAKATKAKAKSPSK